MLNKWMIMIAGVGTVFTALALLILLLWFIRVVFGARKPKDRPSPAPLPELTSPIKAAPAVQQGVSGEVVAAIAAAISAASGRPVSAFRISSITPSAAEHASGFNTPIWGRVERFARK